MTYKKYLEEFIGKKGITESGIFWIGRAAEDKGNSEISEVHEDFVVIKAYSAEGVYERSWAVPLASFWITHE